MTNHLYLIAGEASGDVIGAELMRSVNQRQPDIRYDGIGGDNMQSQGLASLFPMQELSMMGFVEILPHLFRLKKRIRETVEDIIQKQPDMLITIDSPGFTFRVVKALREAGFDKPCVHYVAPTVWAYKPHRAAKTAKLFDALFVLLPFEPPYFEVQGLKTYFVGHPIAWLHKDKSDGAAFRAQHNIPADAKVLGMMPGSRMGELKRHLPVFEQTLKRLIAEFPDLRIVIPTNANIAEHLAKQTAHWPTPVTLSTDKQAAMAACDMALAKSGTVALETALAGIPTITCFKANPLSVWLVRRMVQIPYANLINIMALFEGRDAPIPEFIQEDCTPEKLSEALLQMMHSPEACEKQKQACAHYFDRLGMNESVSPSDKAAELAMGLLG